MGPWVDTIHETWWERFVTWCYVTFPPYKAFADLWVRLFSGLVAPLGLLYLIREEQLFQQQQQQQSYTRLETAIDKSKMGTGTTSSTTHQWIYSLVSLSTIVASIVVMTDSNYVYEYGTYGVSLFVASWGLAVRASTVQQRSKQQFGVTTTSSFAYTQAALVGLALLALALTFDWKTRQFALGEPDEVNVRVSPGLYYNTDNPEIRLAIQKYWAPSKYTYDRPTPWMPTGDARTGLPYFFNRVPNPERLDWKKVYLPVSDGEVLELAIVFPPTTGHNSSQPVYLILHGVNGGTTDGYIQDFALRRTEAGSTVVVMISRGLMDTPLRGWNLFHGARWSDAHETALALHRVLEPGQVLAGVGYSMGAIVLGNYVASAGSECALDVAFAISGALECRHEQNYTRAQRMWQPMIGDFLRQKHYQAKFAERLKARLTRPEMLGFLRSTNVVALDRFTSVAYNDYPTLEHFYSDMGALGDIPVHELKLASNFTHRPKIFNVNVPLGILHAFDDPISTWRTNAANEGILHPQNLVRTGQGNIVLILTETGGHVGWPVGLLPFQKNWEFMNEAAATFVEAVAQAKAERGSLPPVRPPSKIV